MSDQEANSLRQGGRRSSGLFIAPGMRTGQADGAVGAEAEELERGQVGNDVKTGGDCTRQEIKYKKTHKVTTTRTNMSGARH